MNPTDNMTTQKKLIQETFEQSVLTTYILPGYILSWTLSHQFVIGSETNMIIPSLWVAENRRNE